MSPTCTGPQRLSPRVIPPATRSRSYRSRSGALPIRKERLWAKIIVLALLLAGLGNRVAARRADRSRLRRRAGSYFVVLASMSHLILSDPLAATLVVLSVALLTRPGTKHAAVAGALVGASVVVRLANLVTLASLIAALPRRRLRLTAFLAALPFVVTLLVYQWSAFGQPLKTGYDYYLPGLREFAPHYAWSDPLGRDGPNLTGDRLDGRLMSWACPCPRDGPMAVVDNVVYPAVVLGLFWMYTPPLISLLGFAELFRRRIFSPPRYAAAVIVTNVALFTFYFHQAARFMAPVGALLIVFSAVGAVTLILSPLSRRLRRYRAHSAVA